MIKRTCVLIISLCVLTAHAFAVSPPPYTLQRQLKNSYGASACVKVSEVKEIGRISVIYVTGCQTDVAAGLAAVLRPKYQFGNLTVNVEVRDAAGRYLPLSLNQPNTLAGAQRHLTNALQGNPYFVKIHHMPAFITFLVEMKPQLIQFWNDNLADLNGYVHFVAADVFREVTRDQLGPNVTVSFFTSIAAN